MLRVACGTTGSGLGFLPPRTLRSLGAACALFTGTCGRSFTLAGPTDLAAGLRAGLRASSTLALCGYRRPLVRLIHIPGQENRPRRQTRHNDQGKHRALRKRQSHSYPPTKDPLTISHVLFGQASKRLRAHFIYYHIQRTVRTIVDGGSPLSLELTARLKSFDGRRTCKYSAGFRTLGAGAFWSRR